MAGPAETDLYDGNDETSERDRTANGMAPLNSLMGWIQREKGSANHVNKWRSEAKECFRFINGHQTSDADQKALNDARRPNNAFNSAQKFIRFVTGIERVAPTALLFSAIDESDVKQQIYGEFMTRCYDWALMQGDGNFERSRAFYDLIVGGMGWCLPGDTLVRMPEITAAYSRNYTGFVVDVDLENGKRLTGTANHPVLTQMGWKPLNALKEGDNLLSGAVLERIPGFSAKNFDQVETRLTESFLDFPKKISEKKFRKTIRKAGKILTHSLASKPVNAATKTDQKKSKKKKTEASPDTQAEAVS